MKFNCTIFKCVINLSRVADTWVLGVYRVLLYVGS